MKVIFYTYNQYLLFSIFLLMAWNDNWHDNGGWVEIFVVYGWLYIIDQNSYLTKHVFPTNKTVHKSNGHSSVFAFYQFILFGIFLNYILHYFSIIHSIQNFISVRLLIYEWNWQQQQTYYNKKQILKALLGSVNKSFLNYSIQNSNQNLKHRSKQCY